MKINIVSIYFPPENGAAANRVFKMASFLRANGNEVQVITAMPNYPFGKIYKGYKGLWCNEIIDGISVRRYCIYASNSKNPLLRIFSMISFSISLVFAIPILLRRSADINIVCSPPLMSGFVASFLCKLSRGKLVLNISDLWPLSAFELGVIKKGTFYSFLESLESRMYKKADLIMTQSEESVDYIKSKCNSSFFLYRNVANGNKYISEVYPDSRTNGFRIIYAGLLGVAQGILNLLKSLDWNSLDVVLDLYGDGNESNEIQKFIAESGISNIKFHGMISTEQLNQVLPSYHASLIPLVNPIYGAFPSKIFTAMASGLPILYCGEGEAADFVKKYNLGLVNASDDFNGLKDNIFMLKSMPEEEYLRVRQNGIDLSNSTFNFKNINENLVKELSKLVNE